MLMSQFVAVRYVVVVVAADSVCSLPMVEFMHEFGVNDVAVVDSRDHSLQLVLLLNKAIIAKVFPALIEMKHG